MMIAAAHETDDAGKGKLGVSDKMLILLILGAEGLESWGIKHESK